MIKILGRNATTLLTPEQRFEWIDLRGKELQLTETESDGIFSITLDAKPQGARKVLATLVVLATAAIAPAVTEQYAIRRRNYNRRLMGSSGIRSHRESSK